MPEPPVLRQAPADDPRSVRRRRLLSRVLLVAGVALFVWIIRSVGWPAIAASLSRVGPVFGLLVILYSVAQVAFALGWWSVFEPRPPLSAFPKIFAVYLAGDAANALAPGNVAGEPLKVQWMRPSTGGPAALASVTIHKHADLLAQWVFVAAGVGIALVRYPMPLAARIAAVATTAGLGGLLAVMSWALPRGTYSPILRRLTRWKALERPLARWQDSVARTDDRISEYYRDHGARFFAAAGWCLLGWCGGLLETWIVLRLIAPGAGWAEAAAVEGLAMTLNNVFLFIPARIGSAEGVRVAVFLLLGLTAGQGVAYGVVRRAREIAWIIPGVFILLAREGRFARRGPGASDAADILPGEAGR
jgi:hypothetical protein